MLAAYRAELLVLKKWPAAWALLLVTPVFVLLSDYVAELIWYVTLTPAQYSNFGTPAQNLPSMLPSQFVIIAVSQFALKGIAPFIVLGAIMAGGDWGRGTIRTNLLQRQSRAQAFGGQALALVAAVTASVLGTFAVAAAASYIILAIEASAANPAAAAPPSVLVMSEGTASALLVAITYGILGLALGALCRSAPGAISLAVMWTLIVEANLYCLAIYTGDAQRPDAAGKRHHADRPVRHARRRRALAELRARRDPRSRADLAGLHVRGGCADLRRAQPPGRGHRQAQPAGVVGGPARDGARPPAAILAADGGPDPRAGSATGRSGRAAGPRCHGGDGILPVPVRPGQRPGGRPPVRRLRLAGRRRAGGSRPDRAGERCGGGLQLRHCSSGSALPWRCSRIRRC